MDKQQPAILRTPTGGFGFSTLIACFIGIFFLIVQVFLLMQPLETRPNAISFFLPGIAGIFIIALFLIRAMRKGEIAIFQKGVEYRKKNGQVLSFSMEELDFPELFTGKFLLKSTENRLLLLENPREKKAIGTVWLLKQYADWPHEFWKAPFQAASFPQAARHFNAENGKGVACDIGFIIELEEQIWYLPTSGAVRMIGDLGPRERIYERPTTSTEPPLQFEPEPARLPMSWLCGNILDSSLSETDKVGYIEMLVENHGGQLCHETEDQERLLKGECLGYATTVILA